MTQPEEVTQFFTSTYSYKYNYYDPTFILAIHTTPDFPVFFSLPARLKAKAKAEKRYRDYGVFEMTRASFDFTLFNEAYKNHFRDRPLPSASFLQWFIGFTEGDGCFTVAKRGDISFIITQSTSDILILHYIQNVLGFGSVIVQSKDNFTHRYVVQDKLGL